MAKCAWITLLTGNTSYVKGIITIQYSLRHILDSAYPLVVLHTSETPSSIISLLSSIGCSLKKVQSIRPSGTINYSQERFSETWTKLVAWDQDSYDRLVMIDADILPLKNIDELMTLIFPQDDWVAACFACTCNPEKVDNYPSDWIPKKCAHTYTAALSANIEQQPSQTYNHYFNSGVVVLTPQHAKFQVMMSTLKSIHDFDRFTFPDQDFLNEHFREKWTVLPCTYNALKPMVISHASLWDINEIRLLHYILAKPWDVDWSNTNKEHPKYYPLYQLWEDRYQEALTFYNICSEDIDNLLYTKEST